MKSASSAYAVSGGICASAVGLGGSGSLGGSAWFY